MLGVGRGGRWGSFILICKGCVRGCSVIQNWICSSCHLGVEVKGRQKKLVTPKAIPCY